MSNVTYLYSRRPVAPDSLTKTINDSSIVTKLTSISWESEFAQLYIVFAGPLSTEDKAALDLIVSNHDGLPLPVRVVPTLPDGTPYTAPTMTVNQNTLDPSGMVKGRFNVKDYVCNITLSSKSGLTFTYNSDVLIAPEVGGYVFDTNLIQRCEIASVDLIANTITLTDGLQYCDDGAGLDNGNYLFSKPFSIDYKLPSRDTNTLFRDFGGGLVLPAMCLWGLGVNVSTNGQNDFVNLSIICKDGIPDGQGGWVIPPMGYVQNIDYAWIITLMKMGGKITTHDMDGSPAYVPSGFYTRINYFSTTLSLTDLFVEVWLDYIVTVKDGV